MSKILCACLRDGSRRELTDLKKRIAAGAARIQPPGVPLRPASFIASGGVVTAIVNPSTTNRVHGASVAIGCVGRCPRWHVVGTPGPEGSYALCRSDGRSVELVSDAVASRTLWYYLDDEVFIASTSQRWLVSVLGDFEPNGRAVTWMLATGTLGPTDAWDARLRRLPPDSTFTLDRRAWTSRLTCLSGDVFVPRRGSVERQWHVLYGALQRNFDELEFDYSIWALPLSGGYDSRGILCMLRSPRAVQTITWGTRSAMANAASDAAVARRLAESFGVAHEYFHTDMAGTSLTDVLDLFVACGEGRIDHIAGYLDGFAIWKTLASRGIEGIIRGDEGFGWNKVSSCEEARQSTGLLLWSDYGNLPDLDQLALPPQELPECLRYRPGETPAQWRDRLYHGFRIPTMLAALTDLKASFVEVANPLLTHLIIRQVRGLPDGMRTEKALFREIVDAVSPAVPYATEQAIADSRAVLRTRQAVDVLLEALCSETAQSLFPALLLDYVSAHIASEAPARAMHRPRRVKRMLRKLPGPVRQALRRCRPRLRMDLNKLALRLLIVCRMHELLEADACARAANAAGGEWAVTSADSQPSYTGVPAGVIRGELNPSRSISSA